MKEIKFEGEIEMIDPIAAMPVDQLRALLLAQQAHVQQPQANPPQQPQVNIIHNFFADLDAQQQQDDPNAQ